MHRGASVPLLANPAIKMPAVFGKKPRGMIKTYLINYTWCSVLVQKIPFCLLH